MYAKDVTAAQKAEFDRGDDDAAANVGEGAES